ncbi:tetratricopeptide repeat protein [Nocardia alba]|uniref:tetratricopeptide repeat protein n=1 Tax=Nocardia alba TaxID=225051 RepID=UPI00104B2E9B|nr:tetratricopeptide repeat protein [Nocardia alba]
MQPPAEAFQPMAEVEAPAGIDNLESWPRWFVGRETELERLDAAVIAQESVVVAAVHGLGGVGKSSLVAYWAGKHPHGCAPIVWIRADSLAGVEQGLAGFAARLQPALAEALTVEDLAERGLQWLASHTGWLLILDNVEDPADIDALLARARTGRVLITGRLSVPWQADAMVISLDVLAVDKAEELLTGLITAGGPRDLDGVAELCEALGYLPLAVKQAGAYLAQARFTSPHAYLQLLNDQPGLTFDRAAAGTDPQRTIARIWRVTLDRIAETDPAAVELLRILAWYAPDNIPLPLCRSTTDPVTGDAALGLLTVYSMIIPDPTGKGLSIHRLVQAVARTPDPTDLHRDSVSIERARTVAADTLHNTLPNWQDPTTWPIWRSLLPHIEALTSHPASDDIDSLTVQIAAIRNTAGLFLEGQGQHASASNYFHHALTARRRILGDDHPDTLHSRSNLAGTYESAGRITEATTLYKQIFEDSERIMGSDHPDTLNSRNNLAGAYESAGRAAEAITLYKQTLADRQRIRGSDHPDTLGSRNNLASAYETVGRTAEAILLYEQTLTDLERVLGENHPDVLVSRNNLAYTYESAGRIAEAITLHEQTVADSERILGNDHPDTLLSRNNLASAYASAGRVAEAITLHKQTLTDRQRILGSDHPDTLRSRNNLASAYESAGRTAEAITLYEQTLDDRLRILGVDHPDTLRSRNNLATTYGSAGRVAEAILLFEQIRTDSERILGVDHPDTLRSHNSLAAVYREVGRINDAILLHAQTLIHRQRVLGPDHPDTLTSQLSLATDYRVAGQEQEAIPLYERVLDDCVRVLGPDHPLTVRAREDLASARK